MSKRNKVVVGAGVGALLILLVVVSASANRDSGVEVRFEKVGLRLLQLLLGHELRVLRVQLLGAGECRASASEPRSGTARPRPHQGAAHAEPAARDRGAVGASAD